MTADPLVYDRKNKRKVLTHIDGRKQYFTLNNREIEDSEHPYSDELRRGMWKAYQFGREYNHSHDQVINHMRSYPFMNKTILDEIAQRGTEAIPDVESDEDLPLHKPYRFKSDSDIRDIRRSEDEDVMSEAYHNVRFNGGSQADAEKAVKEVAKKYNIYAPHVKGYLARTKTYRDKDFTDPSAKAEWVSSQVKRDPASWSTPEYSRKIDRILNGYDPNRDMRDERPIQTYSALPEDLAKYFDSDDPIPTWHDDLNSLAADNIRSTNVPAMYNSPEPKPVKKAAIDYSVSAGYPDWLSVSDKPEQSNYSDLTPESQYVLQALFKQESDKKASNKAEPMAADYTRVYPDVVPVSIESEEYDLPEEKEKPILESEYVSQGIHAPNIPVAVQQAANPLNTTGQVVRAPVMPNLDPASYVPVNMPARVSQPVLNEGKIKARLDALPDKAISSSMPLQAKPVSKEQIRQNAAERMVRAAYKYNAPEMPKRQQETKSQDVNGNAVLEQPSKYEVPEVTEQVQQPAKQLTEEEIVNGVLHGDYDNGAERIKKLRALGLSDAEIKHIQDIVNARVYAGRAIVQRKKTAPRAPRRVSRQQIYNGFSANFRPY